MSGRPVIGVTPDVGVDARGLPRYELRAAYADAVLAAGGLPLVLPYHPGAAVVAGYLGLIDGLVLSGGGFDVPPALYGERKRPGLGELKPARTDFELALLQGALRRRLPVLGICGGMQLLNVACGGSLYQDLARELPEADAHEQPGDRRRPSHGIRVVAKTRLAAAVGQGALRVNSTHHQAVRRLGRGLVVSAAAKDGVVEAIEARAPAFVVGVQWHPELLVKSVPRNLGLYRALVRAAARRPNPRTVRATP